MTLEEMAVLAALNRYRTLSRQGLSTMAELAYPKVSEERLWLAAIDTCLSKRWIEHDPVTATYTLTLRGIANLKADLQSVQNLVASVGWLG